MKQDLVREIAMRLLIPLSAFVATHFAHAAPIDNGDIVSTIWKNYVESSLLLHWFRPPESVGRGNILNSVAALVALGNGSYDRGDYDSAVRVYQKAFEVYGGKWERSGNEGNELDKNRLDFLEDLAKFNIQHRLAKAYSGTEDHGKAIALAEKLVSRERAQHGDKGPTIREALDTLADLYRKAGQLDKAVALQEETVRWNRATFGDDNAATQMSLIKLASLFMTAGRYEKARELYGQVYRFWVQLKGDENTNLQFERLGRMAEKGEVSRIYLAGQANAYVGLGQPEKALALLERDLDRIRKETPIVLARIYFELGRADMAQELIPTIMADFEKRRTGPAKTAEDRQRAFAMLSSGYHEMAIWLARGTKPDQESDFKFVRDTKFDQAFHIGDLSKARTLAESIRAQVALRTMPEGQLQTLQAEAVRSLALRDRVHAVRMDAKEIKALGKEVEESIESFRLRGLLQKTNVKYPTPDGSIIDDAGELLGKDAVFISFLISSEGQGYEKDLTGEIGLKSRAQVFVLNGTGKVAWRDLGRLPNHAKTVAAYRELVTAIDARDLDGRLVALQDGGYQWVEKGQAAPEGSRPETVPSGSAPTVHALRVLQRYWHDTLIKPLLPLTEAYNRWIISPDKDLALLPFDTLPETLTAKGDADKLLAEQRNISLVQSFSVYALLKKREVEYANLRRPKSLLAMGNAVYDKAGWALNRGMRRGAGKRGFTAGDGVDTRGQTRSPLEMNSEQHAMARFAWENLPGTADEIRRVTAMFVESDGSADSLTGVDASEAKLRELNQSRKLMDYRYLLFSAHGYLAKNPTLSSLVLSQHGNPVGLDGYITAGEWPLYDVRSDLTVLSACDTGVGKVQVGEGVMGLPYALFVAGNRNTLLSLWPVADEATAEFMARFFGKLKQGRTQPAALSETKQEFMRHPTWSKPVFWAAFVLYGV